MGFKIKKLKPPSPKKVVKSVTKIVKDVADSIYKELKWIESTLRNNWKSVISLALVGLPPSAMIHSRQFIRLLEKYTSTTRNKYSYKSYGMYLGDTDHNRIAIQYGITGVKQGASNIGSYVVDTALQGNYLPLVIYEKWARSYRDPVDGLTFAEYIDFPPPSLSVRTATPSYLSNLTTAFSNFIGKQVTVVKAEYTEDVTNALVTLAVLLIKEDDPAVLSMDLTYEYIPEENKLKVVIPGEPDPLEVPDDMFEGVGYDFGTMYYIVYYIQDGKGKVGIYVKSNLPRNLSDAIEGKSEKTVSSLNGIVPPILLVSDGLYNPVPYERKLKRISMRLFGVTYNSFRKEFSEVYEKDNSENSPNMFHIGTSNQTYMVFGMMLESKKSFPLRYAVEFMKNVFDLNSSNSRQEIEYFGYKKDFHIKYSVESISIKFTTGRYSNLLEQMATVTISGSKIEWIVQYKDYYQTLTTDKLTYYVKVAGVMVPTTAHEAFNNLFNDTFIHSFHFPLHVGTMMGMSVLDRDQLMRDALGYVTNVYTKTVVERSWFSSVKAYMYKFTNNYEYQKGAMNSFKSSDHFKEHVYTRTGMALFGKVINAIFDAIRWIFIGIFGRKVGRVIADIIIVIIIVIISIFTAGAGGAAAGAGAGAGAAIGAAAASLTAEQIALMVLSWIITIADQMYQSRMKRKERALEKDSDKIKLEFEHKMEELDEYMSSEMMSRVRLVSSISAPHRLEDPEEFFTRTLAPVDQIIQTLEGLVYLNEEQALNLDSF